ncbi:MAG: 6-phosphogluconolactonase [Planctomycetes bacterium]|nr:6-phosphogluconolactonase [Planctomycetota bacterium]
MRVNVAQSATAAAVMAAATLAAKIEAAVKSRGVCSIALSGGETPWQMLEALLSEPVSWGSLHVFQVDERAVRFDDERRNARRIRELLVRPGRLPASQFHAMPVDAAVLARCASGYSETLAMFAGKPPVLDVVQLGLGPDGHTASLVPGDALLDLGDAEVGVSGVYQGMRRLSLTFAALNRARCILWLVTGGAKAAMLRSLVAHDAAIPAGRVARTQAIVIADVASAAALSDADRHAP